MKVLMIDNYDSFTFNIVQYLGELGAEVDVVRNDEISVAQIGERIAAGVTRLVVSPGPCSPAEAGVSVPAIEAFAGKLPILGVCLGHQAIGAAFGGSAISEWAKGARHYTAAVARARAALKVGKLAGILWHQGEADSKDESLAGSYAHRFDTFIRQLRADLEVPDVPVIVGELGRFYRDRPNGGARFADVVNAQLKQIPELVRHSTFVSSEGLTDKGDATHFDTRSLHEFGARYAQAFLRLDPSWTSRK